MADSTAVSSVIDSADTHRARRTTSPQLIGQLRPVAALVVALLVLGVLLGLVWAWWSPPVPAGVNLHGGVERQESEAFFAADARFAVITLAVGFVAGAAAWFVRSTRGPWMALGLAVGGLGGALLTAAVGNAVGGGTDDAPLNAVIPHLELRVQMTGSVYFEAAVAVLVYIFLVAFAAADDLGRPDGERDALQRRSADQLQPVSAGPASIAPYGGVQDARGHGDGPGPAQQYNFPAQEPH